MAVRTTYTATIPAFARLSGQPQVASYLENAVKENKVSHAYLFVGPAGCGQTEAALALAKSLVCSKGGCNACEECIRADRRSHPDIFWYKPEGASGYVVSQIQALTQDVVRTPARAKYKIYILEAAETLTGVCANALLKTIEEPPSGVVFILMARSLDAVLPTIASRCQCVPFRVTNTEEAIKYVVLTCGLPNDSLARIALSVAGTPERACDFARSAKRQELRQLVVRTLGELPLDDDWDILQSASAIMDAYSDKQKAKAKQKTKPADLSEEERAALEREELENDFLSAKGRKLRDQAKKRELTASERSGMIEIIQTVASVLRDVLINVSGADESLVNTDVVPVIERLSKGASVAGTLKALEACSQATTSLNRNVTPQLILEVMLLSCKEALCPPLSR